MLPYLSEVSYIKKVEGLEKVAFLHAKYLAACRQERPDVLQAQELLVRQKGFICEQAGDVHAVCNVHDATCDYPSFFKF